MRGLLTKNEESTINLAKNVKLWVDEILTRQLFLQENSRWRIAAAAIENCGVNRRILERRARLLTISDPRACFQRCERFERLC